MSRLIFPLRPFPAHQLPAVGGKAASLGEALGHKERVPEGFVLTALALGAVLEENGLTETYGELLAAARRDDAQLEALADAFAERLKEAEWPASLRQELEGALRVLGAERVAVRSSANLEDGEASAAAGIFESLLDVQPEDAWRAANRVWAESCRARVFWHLLAAGQDPGALRVGLLFQRMLAPELSGVLFTTDADDPERARMRLAVVQGQGAALVQGEAGEDHTLPRSGTLPEVPGLAAGRLDELRKLALRMEERAGRALDLEWALEDGRLWLLQARPITAIAPGEQQRKPIRWSRDLATERFPDPISPLGWTALQSALRVNLQTLDRRFGLQAQRPEEVATVIGGYVYNNRDFFAIPQSMRFRTEAHMPYLGAYLRVLAGLVAPTQWPTFLQLLKPKRSALGASPTDPRFRAVAGLFEAYLFKHAEEVEKAWKKDFPEHLRQMDKLSAEDVTAMSTPKLLDYARRVIARSDAFMEPDLAIYVIKMACRWAVEEIVTLVRGSRDPALLARLTGGLAANATVAMNASLDQLFEAVRADETLVQALLAGDGTAAWQASPAEPQRRQFLKDYGHITLSWDIRHPTYADEPRLLDELLAARLRSPEPGSASARRSQLGLERATLADGLARDLARTPRAKSFFYRALETLYTFMRLDEEHHLYCGRLIPAERRIVAELASRLVALGAFGSPDDIHFLTLDEVFALAEEKAPWSRARLVARRRLAYERAVAQRPIEEYLGNRPVATSQSVPAGTGTLQGKPASAGRVEGRVRLVSSMADMAAFQPGEILVLPTPKPSYTPLFAVAGGLVTARGSTLSHGLITAREYGLPAVTELHDAFDRLATGQRVCLDGDTGSVTLLEDAPLATGRS